MDYKSFRLIIVAITLCTLQNSVESTLKCYTCTATEAGSDCELHPDKVAGGITDCNKKYCTLRRVEYISTSVVYSFYRSCEDNPVYVNNIIEDDTYRTYFYACTKPLCNGSSGKSDTSNGGNGIPPGVTKPPFNDRVLHSGKVKLEAQVTLVLVLVAAVLYLGMT